MFTVELYARIRRAVMADGLSRRDAAKQFGVHRNTISKMLQFSIPPGYRRRERPVSKKLGPHMAWIDAILEGGRSVHKKRRHTAHRNAGAVRLTLKSLFLLTRLVHIHAAIRHILSPPFTQTVVCFRTAAWSLGVPLSRVRRGWQGSSRPQNQGRAVHPLQWDWNLRTGAMPILSRVGKDLGRYFKLRHDPLLRFTVVFSGSILPLRWPDRPAI